MRRLLVMAGAALALLCNPANAEWANKNDQINATNFIMMDQGSPFCSATLISLKHKLVLTAHHCVEQFIHTREFEENHGGEVKKVKREVYDPVTLSQKSYQGHENTGEASYQATIVAKNVKRDMALLQIKADSIPQTIFSQVLPADKKVARGDRVWAVGNPLGTLDATLTAGIISSTTRMMRPDWAERADVPFLQTDAAINGGNSGGALYDDEGNLIGIPDAGWRGSNNLSLALTPESIRSFLKENCWMEIYTPIALNTVESHNDCVQRKRAEENKRREKAGEPLLKDNDEGEEK